MGIFSKRQVIEHALEFGTGPTRLFNIFTNPQNGKEIFGAKSFEIVRGQPTAPGSMEIYATYDTAPLVQYLPILGISDEVVTHLKINMAINPHRILSVARKGSFEQQTEVIFTPQGKGTVVSFETSYEVPLALRPLTDGIRGLFGANTRGSLAALAQLANDKKALSGLPGLGS